MENGKNFEDLTLDDIADENTNFIITFHCHLLAHAKELKGWSREGRSDK